MFSLEADPPESLTGTKLRDAVELHAVLDRGAPRHLAGRLGRVAGIRQKPARITADNQNTVTSGETGKVADVTQIKKENRVNILFFRASSGFNNPVL
ncbi:hypothetical protein GHYDROH2_05500 [Geobacter hydrogenophilus]|uniref:Uncharacterized protein n=1 Tax=Geobacter hydrogenophilus TaxID=40983 RepID=A0A9W6LBK5_9BACT|nr:hypothetical protein GHYDROH2_05500 [Geobacter hydrogenophilus]